MQVSSLKVSLVNSSSQLRYVCCLLTYSFFLLTFCICFQMYPEKEDTQSHGVRCPRHPHQAMLSVWYQQETSWLLLLKDTGIYVFLLNSHALCLTYYICFLVKQNQYLTIVDFKQFQVNCFTVVISSNNLQQTSIFASYCSHYFNVKCCMFYCHFYSSMAYIQFAYFLCICFQILNTADKVVMTLGGAGILQPQWDLPSCSGIRLEYRLASVAHIAGIYNRILYIHGCLLSLSLMQVFLL